MPLQTPNLDTRTFEELLTEARLRIPQYTPEWTNFNDSDPGMTLVQLFAWFTELMLFQMNRLPDLNYIKFLQLLNLELQPAQAATTHVVFTLTNDAPVTSVPERTRFDVPLASDAGLPYFETTQPIDLSPFPLDSVQVFDGSSYADYSALNQTGTDRFGPFGPSPQPGSALYLGFKPREGGADPHQRFPSELVFRFFLPPSTLDSAQNFTSDVKTAKAQQTLVWEYRSQLDVPKGGGPGMVQRWRPLTQLSDETLALTKEGDIHVRGPGIDVLATMEGKLTDPKRSRYWLRVRLAEGAYPEAAVPEIAFVRSNVVQVENLITIKDEELGTSDGSSQTYTLRHTPVADRSLLLEVQVPSRPEPDVWTQVQDFLASKRADPHYTLDRATGEIAFGDGIRGRIPEPGGVITARLYLAGGGAAGNVDAGAISSPPATVSDVDSVTNPRRALGGSDQEALDDLKALAPKAIRGIGRAVTADDYQYLAQGVTGVLKAVAIPNRHPRYRGFPVPGAVTVVIVPDDGTAEPKPLPELRAVVFKTLAEARVLTSELFVADPRYRRLEVQAQVLPGDDVSQDLVIAQLATAITNYFKPKDWDFGETFYPSALYEVLLSATEEQSGYKLIKAVVQLDVADNGKVVSKVQMDDDELPVCLSPTVTIAV